MPLLANSINTNFSSGFKVFQVAERLAKGADEMNAALRISKESLNLLLTHVMPHNSYISEKLTGGAPERYTACCVLSCTLGIEKMKSNAKYS